MTRIRLSLAVIAVVAFASVLYARQAPQTQEDAEFLRGVYLLSTPNLVAPQEILAVRPKYTPDAMRNKMQGAVGLQIVVGIDGLVSRVRVTKSLDKTSGLDDAALEAAKQWKFKPGKLNGEAVPVAIPLALEFRLRKTP